MDRRFRFRRATSQSHGQLCQKESCHVNDEYMGGVLKYEGSKTLIESKWAFVS